jgi:hypothetical protein
MFDTNVLLGDSGDDTIVHETAENVGQVREVSRGLREPSESGLMQNEIV